MRPGRTIAISVIGLLATLSGTGSGAIADTLDVGSTPGLPNEALSCSTPGIYFQDAVTTTPGYTTTAGVVTSWTVMAATLDPASTVALRTAVESSPDTYTITGASDAHTLVAGRLNTFSTRIPVHLGDELALELPPQTSFTATCLYSSGVGSDVVRSATITADQPVGSVVPTTGVSSSHRLDVSARVEPDADGDGYGDLTQDACPGLANSHTDCTPPDTFLTSGPLKKVVTTRKTAKVSITFVASEQATLRCQVDKAAPAPCSGRLTAKLPPGKHTLSITATDAVGNVDPTPLVVPVKVKHAKAR